MAVPGPVFVNVTGTPASPTFAEYVIKGHVVESSGASQQIINILHFARISGPGTDTEAHLYAAVSGLLDGALDAALSDTYVPDETLVRFMDDPMRAAFPNANALTGAIAGDRHPSFTAVVTRKKTAGRGRSFKGSNHWAPIAESDTLLDQLAGASVARWAAVEIALETMCVPFAGNADMWQLMVLSPTLSDFSLNPSVFTGALCNDIILNLVVGTMRRRKQGVGV